MKYPRPTLLAPGESERIQRFREVFGPQAKPKVKVIRDFSQVVRRIRRRQWWATAPKTQPFPYYHPKTGAVLAPNVPARRGEDRVAETHHESPNRADRRRDAKYARQRA